jgi:type I restriction enzyme S subunit
MKPEIRLKGFSGEWKQTTIGNLFAFKNGLNKGKEYFGYGTPIVNYTDVYKNRILKKSMIKGKVNLDYNEINRYRVRVGDVFFTRTSETPEEVGYASVLTEDIEDCSFSGFVLRARPITDELVPEFCGECFSVDSVRYAIKSTCTYTTRALTNGRVLSEININYPSKDEQNAIAMYFQNIDALIQTTLKKVESLKQLKSASMISMFPQHGETKPRLRFKGFEGEWKSKDLIDCVTISKECNSGNRYGVNDVLSVSDDFGVVNQIELLGRSYAGKSVTNYKILHKDEIVYTKSPLKSKPFGIVKKNNYKTGIVSVLYAVYKVNEGISAGYIHYYFDPSWRLNSYLRPLVNKGAKNTMNISDEMALTGSIMLPPTLDEQRQIADFFTALDRRITLETQRLEKLKQIKSACLDKMFV